MSLGSQNRGQGSDLESDFSSQISESGSRIGSRVGFQLSDLRIEVENRISELIFGFEVGFRSRGSDLGGRFRVQIEIGSSFSDVGSRIRGRSRISESDFEVGGRFSVPDSMSEVGFRSRIRCRRSRIGVRAFNFGLHPEIGDPKSRVAAPQNSVFGAISSPK